MQQVFPSESAAKQRVNIMHKLTVISWVMAQCCRLLCINDSEQNIALVRVLSPVDGAITFLRNFGSHSRP
jgi:hypothetical protein